MEPRSDLLPGLPSARPSVFLSFIPHAAYNPELDALVIRLQEDGYDERLCGAFERQFGPSAVVFQDRESRKVVGLKITGVSLILGALRQGTWIANEIVKRARECFPGLFGSHEKDIERLIYGLPLVVFIPA